MRVEQEIKEHAGPPLLRPTEAADGLYIDVEARRNDEKVFLVLLCRKNVIYSTGPCHLIACAASMYQSNRACLIPAPQGSKFTIVQE